MGIVRRVAGGALRRAGLRPGLNGRAETDEQFLQRVYRTLLDRDVDPAGLATYREELAHGLARADLVLRLATSEEHRNRIVSAAVGLEDLKALRPERYAIEHHVEWDSPVDVFVAETPEDFDWLERAILDFGYYETAGVWGFEVDLDKRLMAEVVARLGARRAPPSAQGAARASSPAQGAARALDLGCANGTVMACLDELGVRCDGVDISRLALRKAVPSVRDRIFIGDVLDLDLPGPYDVVFGLDIFEHFNPNRLDDYLRRVAELVRDGGYVFTNVPAFGADPVFGTVFPFYVRRWEQEAAAGRLFSRLHVDLNGYPLNGHLVWADWRWWVERFEAAGLRREPEVEQALHEQYDAAIEGYSLARKSFFVFSKRVADDDRAALVDRLRSTTSTVLEAS